MEKCILIHFPKPGSSLCLLNAQFPQVMDFGPKCDKSLPRQMATKFTDINLCMAN